MGLISIEANLALSVAIPFAVSLVVTAVVTALLIPFLKRIKSTQAIYELAPEEHKQKSGTPTMGGIGILCGTAAGCVAAVIVLGAMSNLLFILAITLVFGGIGMIDDMKKITKRQNLGLKARHKLVLQIVIALACVLYYLYAADMGTYIILPFVWNVVDIGPWIYPYMIFIIVAMVNSVNLTDGLDGLASGTSFVVAIFFPVFALLGFSLSLTGGGEVVIEGVSRSMVDAMIFPALAGACIGFLIFNRHPAKIFMGDTGSLALGGGLSAGAIFTHVELFLPLAGFVFVAEALSDIIQVGSYKLRNGKRVFKMAPLHHHFELSGWHEKKVVAAFVTVTLVMCVVCTVVLVLQGRAMDL
ncbi:MAG: phospho-N-acetylmuramoyl-pentapeptide-transferase [Clostridiales bacterium]|nr:phospho-N-acetylmuramoyl-pentapeptide-transferase [Clostridiales bacterium]